jgi:hypothetical protein
LSFIAFPLLVVPYARRNGRPARRNIIPGEFARGEVSTVADTLQAGQTRYRLGGIGPRLGRVPGILSRRSSRTMHVEPPAGAVVCCCLPDESAIRRLELGGVNDDDFARTTLRGHGLTAAGGPLELFVPGTRLFIGIG